MSAAVVVGGSLTALAVRETQAGDGKGIHGGRRARACKCGAHNLGELLPEQAGQGRRTGMGLKMRLWNTTVSTRNAMVAMPMMNQMKKAAGREDNSCHVSIQDCRKMCRGQGRKAKPV